MATKVPGYMMNAEPYTVTQDQINALNTLPPGIYHVCSGCRKFQPMSDTLTVHFENDAMLCERCARHA